MQPTASLKLHKPDIVFVVTVHPIEPSGYEFWGENGYLQATAKTDGQMRDWIARKAREQERTGDGRICGYRFRLGNIRRAV